MRRGVRCITEWPLLDIQLEPLPVCSYELQPASGGLGTHDQAPWLQASCASMQGNEPRTTFVDSTSFQAPVQLVGFQVLRSTHLCTSLPSTEQKAGRSPENSQTGHVHAQLCRLRACRVLIIRTHIPWFPACADTVISQKLSVVFHTADSEIDLIHTTMPSPSAKLKASRRLPKHLRESGAPPSGALAKARADAEMRYARGESNRQGQHSCLQGRSRTVRAAEEQRTWSANSWQDDWGGKMDGKPALPLDPQTSGRRDRHHPLRQHRGGDPGLRPRMTSARHL